MRKNTALLAVSLVANAALLAALLVRHLNSSASGEPNIPAVISEKSVASTGGKNALETALLTGDAAALTAAGVPPEVIKALSVGRAFMKFRENNQRLSVGNPEQYWRGSMGIDYSKMSPEERRELAHGRTEFSQAIQNALGADLGEVFGGRASRYSFLPPEKQALLRKIDQDYQDLSTQLESDQSLIELPSDREKRRLLTKERERDIAAALTPEEREDYELRVSNTADVVRSRYGEAFLTEDQYKRVYALQKEFEDRYQTDTLPFGTKPSAEVLAAREEDQHKLQEKIIEMIGAEQWAAASRSREGDRRALESLSQRLNLPASATDAVYALKESYARQSMEINANATLAADERQAQLQSLANKARTDLQSALGPEGGPAFAQSARWMNLLREGQAFSTNPKDAPKAVPYLGQSVFPVPPPKSPSPRG